MFNTKNLNTRAFLTKDWETDQTWSNFIVLLANGINFVVGEGLAQTGSSSSVVAMTAGGFPDQEIVTTLRSGNGVGEVPDLGAIARLAWFGSQGDALYYWARVTSTSCRIVLVDESQPSSFNTLATAPYSLSPGEPVSITFRCIGTSLTAVFSSTSGGTETLSVVDSTIPNGLLGVRTFNQPAYFMNAEVTQL